MELIRGAAILWLLARTLAAQPPGIGQNGIVNAASLIPPTLPGGALAPGVQFRLTGVRLGDSRHTQVAIHAGNSTFPATILEVHARFLTAILPREVPIGHATLTVTADDKTSRAFPIEIATSNPGIFSANGSGWGSGRIENIASSGARSRNSPANPAARGQTIALVTTGLGNMVSPAVVIGNRSVKPSRAKPTGSPGEQEIAVTIPSDAPVSCYVPVYLPISPERASNVVTVAIRGADGRCDEFAARERVAIFSFTRTAQKSVRANVPDGIEDEGLVMLTTQGREFRWHVPPPGTCLAFTGSFQSENSAPTSLSGILQNDNPAIPGRGLDAGKTLMLRRGDDVRIMDGPQLGEYRAPHGYGGSEANRHRPALFLDPGTIVVTGAGGVDVPAFQISLSAPRPFQWTDRDQISSIDRSSPLTVHWKGAQDGTVVVGATNIDQVTTASGTCVCAERGSAGKLTIPPALMGNIPASSDVEGIRYDRLFIGSVGLRTSPGFSTIERSMVITAYALGRVVEFR